MAFLIQPGASMMLFGVFITILVFSAVSPSSMQSCPVASSIYDISSNTCFWRVSSLLSATLSMAECAKDDGVLAVIPDLATQQFIQTQYSGELESGSEKYVGYWIGVTDAQTEGVFLTYDGQAQNYTNWKSGDPNDNNMPAQDCARMFPMELPGYLWQDRSCSESAPGLCSRKFRIMTTDNQADTAVTEDTTTTILASVTAEEIQTTADKETTIKVQKETTEMTSPVTTEMTTTSSFYSQSTSEITESSDTCSACSSTEPNTTCYCTCSPYLTLDDPLVEQKIQELIETLSISKKNTSANRRKYISVADNRPSARGIGYVGAAILVASLGSVILLDLSTFFRHARHLTMKATGREDNPRVRWAIRNPS